MAKFGGTKRGLTRLWVPFSLEEGGKIFDLSGSLVFQQSTSVPETGTTAEFQIDVGVKKYFPFSPAGDYITGQYGLGFGPPLAHGRYTLGPSAGSIADALSFSSNELTFSVWISGSIGSTNIDDSPKKYLIESSGTHGQQFSFFRHIDSSSPSKYTAAMMVFSSSGGQTFKNIVATSKRTVGLNAAKVYGESADGGRLYEKSTTEVQSFSENLIDFDSNDGWQHFVYVLRSARNPFEEKFSDSLNKSASPLRGMSKTNQNGLNQLWVNGELTYESPEFRGFPQGFAPYFFEDGINGLTGKKGQIISQLGDNAIGPEAIRQTNPVIHFSGSSDGDVIAQMAIWRRALSKEEIQAIYHGTKNGVYTKQISSYSSTAKRLIGIDTKKQILPQNFGFPDVKINNTQESFFDSDGIIPAISDNQSFEDLDTGITFFENGIKAYDAKLTAFSDLEDPTKKVLDDEYVIPDGGSMIKIDITNQDPNSCAGRFQASGTLDLIDKRPTFRNLAGLSETSPYIGTGFLYYSPVLKRWVEKSPSAISSMTADPSDVYDNPDSYFSSSNFVRNSYGSGLAIGQLTPTGTCDMNSIMAQFAWSPQFGYFVNHVEHLQQAGYERIGWPTAAFGAPNAPKYHAFDHETFKLKDYIDRPFLLKKVIVKIPVKAQRRFGPNPYYDYDPATNPELPFENSPAAPPAGGHYGPSRKDPSSTAEDEFNKKSNRQVTNKKDIDNYTFFLYRQRRVSRHRDTISDWSTSKRYLIASASVCFYNSGSFGGAWTDGFFTDASPLPVGSKWMNITTLASQSLSAALAYPEDTVDFWGQSLTRITSSNPILHNPQYIHDWEMERFFNSDTHITSSYKTHSTVLNLTMLPTVVPQAQVAPSLIPMTASLKRGYAGREGSFYGLAHITSGTRGDPTDSVPVAPCVTLVSNRWTGGSRPPQIAGSQPTDPYDTISSAYSEYTEFAKGTIDAEIIYASSLVGDVLVSSQPSASGALSKTVFTPPPGILQGHGISMFPTSNQAASTSEESQLTEKRLLFQQPIDPSSVNSPIPAGDYEKIQFAGRRATVGLLGASLGKCFSVGTNYMQYYGWRFISSFQISDFNAKQVYSPTLLYPEDELILGLDAGTFGPPDVDVDDLPGDANPDGPLAGTTPDGSLSAAAGKRVFKNTFLKEDYRIIMSDSSLKILTGDAEITLIGDFLQNESSKAIVRGTTQDGNVSSYYGNDPITDQSWGYNAELLSGSMFTRIFSGSAGQEGVIDGTRRFFIDAGARR